MNFATIRWPSVLARRSCSGIRLDARRAKSHYGQGSDGAAMRKDHGLADTILARRAVLAAAGQQANPRCRPETSGWPR